MDGGLSDHNPCEIAYQEFHRIAPDFDYPDHLVSVGTGLTSDVRKSRTDAMLANPVYRTGEHYSQNNFNGRYIFRRMYDTIKATLPRGSRDIDGWLHRFDLPMDAELPDLADAEAIDSLAHKAWTYFCSHPDVEDLARAVLASNFYFQLRRMPVYADGHFVCYGRILSRISVAHPVFPSLMQKLDAEKAQFVVQGRTMPVGKARLLVDRSGNFCRPVYFRVRKLTELVDLQLKLDGERGKHISASPMPVETFVRLQRLEWAALLRVRTTRHSSSKRSRPVSDSVRTVKRRRC